MSLIEIENLNFSYGSNKILTDINISVESKDIVALIGPSGGGKTTLLRILAGFEKPDSGKIHISGVDVTHIDPHERKIGFVFQDLALFPHLTVRENICYGIDHGFKHCNDWLELFKIQDLAKKYPHQISGGQKQRVALARSLASKPDIILFDEGFSALDKHLRVQVLKEVRDILKEFKITSVMVTHDQEEAFFIADKLAVMDAGQVIQHGSPSELYFNPHNLQVAKFLGDLNKMEIKNDQGNKVVTEFGELEITSFKGQSIYLRPEHIQLNDQGNLKGVVTNCFFNGYNYTLEINHRLQIKTENCLSKNEKVSFSVDLEKAIYR